MTGVVEIYASRDKAIDAVACDISKAVKVLMQYQKPFVLGVSKSPGAESLSENLRRPEEDFSNVPVIILEKMIERYNEDSGPHFPGFREVRAPIGELTDSRCIDAILDKNEGAYHIEGSHVVIYPGVDDSALRHIMFSARYFEKKLREYGGIDMAVLDLGKDGSVLKNAPGANTQTRTHLVKAHDNNYWVTAGLGTLIRESADRYTTNLVRNVVLMGFGEEYADVVGSVVDSRYEKGSPASFVRHAHPNIRIILDSSAAGKLTGPRAGEKQFRKELSDGKNTVAVRFRI